MERNISVDILKLVLSFMVVGLHTNFLRDLSFPVGYVLKNGFFRMAVPLFFIINGYYFYNIFTENKKLFWV